MWCGYQAYIASEGCWSEYKRILDKGQVPSRDVLKTVFGVDFIMKILVTPLQLRVLPAPLGHSTSMVATTSVGARPLADGGLLVLLDGQKSLGLLA